jgi:hypothetical protein
MPEPLATIRSWKARAVRRQSNTAFQRTQRWSAFPLASSGQRWAAELDH